MYGSASLVMTKRRYKSSLPGAVSRPNSAMATDQEEPGSTKPEAGTLYSAKEMHDHAIEVAEEELERPAPELIVSALASGLLVSFSFLAGAFLVHHGSPEHKELLVAAGYPLGFAFVVLAQHQLFTENTLEPVLPVLEKRDRESLRKMLRLWMIVLPGNLIGTAIFGFVVARTPVLVPELHQPLTDVALDILKGGAGHVFYKAIWAGWLVALMAWLLNATRNTMAQIALIWLATAPIAAFGFRHSIAGATEAFYLVARGSISIGDALLTFELPALAGNIIGGVVLVAMVNHGQAGGGKKSRKRES
jgi:formate/nitrite transporter FocA (FNT family)